MIVFWQTSLVRQCTVDPDQSAPEEGVYIVCYFPISATQVSNFKFLDFFLYSGSGFQPMRGTLTFACYIGSLPTLIFNQKNTNDFWHTKKKQHLSMSQYQKKYQDYILQPMVLTKISNQIVEFI